MSHCPTRPHAPKGGSRMSPVSQAVLCHVYEHPDCTLQALQTLFCPDSPSGKGSSTNGFRARLAYLVSVGHLKRTHKDGVSGYRIGTGDRPTRPAPAPDSVPAAAEGEDLQRTPGAQYDRMNGPAFTYTLSQPERPGALDFKRCASVGYSC